MGLHQSALYVMHAYQTSYSLGFLLYLYSREDQKKLFLCCTVCYGWIVDQGDHCHHSGLYSNKLRCFDYVVPRDLAILLRCSRNWEEMLHAVYSMRSLYAREALRKGAQFRWWGESGRMLVLSFLPSKGISHFIAVFYECFVYLWSFWSFL